MGDKIILGIESSCDDTSAAVFKNNINLSNVIASQKVHQAYGGVVPELASRAHQQNIVPVVHQALKEARLQLNDLDAIAYTKGPGLLGSLLVGASFAKSLAYALNIPLIEVNHMQAHILAHFIDDEIQKAPDFPFLGVTISGGHTQIVKVKHYFDMEVIGETLDDAIGEAYDKCGKMLGLDYPAGPQIDQLARLGNPHQFQFSKPKVSDLNFSFSGLKTAVLYFLQREHQKNSAFIQENLNDICASFQYTVVQILMDKIFKAVKQTGIKNVAIGGGVSANSAIRKALLQAEEKGKIRAFIPKFEYCTDNAGMIAVVGYYSLLQNRKANTPTGAKARLHLNQL
ncbi:tRNA (adenosine(37)-N6)-threonylcarbamoyltransferase complex transferase subunit TsaD [Psychroflexus maritimus]|uniref:tRNA N6-adenosine threonylcarbamoyltransferase n=1 Tax=Psychroflexus maritimus TaxID=2714865 RepID=A0A967DZH2_9FLAO|nr:tRNA (adenosine(37)-N6)-threonylcarbamoyltransferase complex transferase subunit TsaD [Psychroflexus maritimus]NGZ89497.1 tRNA (adenosine(37)-N6)-threonylcarbamoyltransferase complex transferase subunit TsaD [Psychroflexus maritimus]